MFDDYDSKVRIKEEENKRLIAEFEASMVKEGLAAKTIRTHVGNADTYLNLFLLHDGINSYDSMLDGDILSYFGWFLPEKCVFTSATSLTANLATIKKLFKFLYDKKLVKKEAMELVNAEIKENKDEWLEKAKESYDEAYNDVFF